MLITEMAIMETSLSDIEAQELAQRETIIERGLKSFVEVGTALLDIRDKRLYRNGYGTFEDYCKERWGFTDERARLLMRSSEVLKQLTPTIVGVLPINEAQARPLTSLTPDEQISAWQRVIDTAPDGKITAAHVQDVVDEIKNKPHVTNNSGNNEWYTPGEYIEAAKRVMDGKIYKLGTTRK